MYFSIMLSLLTIKTDYSYSVVRLDEIQAIEVVDIDRPDESGILTITLKGDKDDLVYSEMNKERWEEAKEWLIKHTLELSMEITKATKVNKEPNQF